LENPYVELLHVSKYFAKVIANHDVSIKIERGKVVALLGENGAGKSTIMKILYGLYRADEGKILMDGKEAQITSPREAIALGISMIQQHFSLVPVHTVTENIILGNVRGVIDRAASEASIRALSDKYAFGIDPNATVASLSVGEQQKVEILKALYLDSKLLIMDEPTAVLTPKESSMLMQFIRDFAAAGGAVVFITHKLKEVMEVADSVVVMRGGKVAGTLQKEGTNEQELAGLMIGKDLIPTTGGGRSVPDDAPVCLELNGVTLQNKGEVSSLEGITFQIRQGEVFGVAGVSGNGQLELCEVVCGATRPTGGSLTLNGEDITGAGINERIQKGIGYVPSDRQRDALVMDMTLAENMMLKSIDDPKWKINGLLLSERKIDRLTQQAIEDYNVKAPGPRAVIQGLSGGNQQKMVLARELISGERLIVFDQPTRGLDLGAIDLVHKTILAQRDAGKSILLVSTELTEIFALSDRVAVMYKGKIQGILERDKLDINRIGLLMAGYHDEEEEAASV